MNEEVAELDRGEGDEDQSTSPLLDLAGFAGPLAQLLVLARAQAIDLREISLTALIDQLVTALESTGARPLAQKGDWLVMAAWLVLLRARLLLPPDTPAQAEAVTEAGRLRENLLSLRAAQGLATWLAARPQVGHDVFARGAPEWLGTEQATAYQIEVVSFLWASVALFDDGPGDGDTDSAYRLPLQYLYSPLDAQQRILAVLQVLPDGAPLERCLPVNDVEEAVGARPALWWRSAWASTLLAGLELARQEVVALAQDGTFMPIRLRRADALYSAHQPAERCAGRQ